MAQPETNSRAGLSFRRLIRFSIAAQVIVIAIVVFAALLGALASVDTSGELKRRTNDLLLLRGVQQEFDRSRLALREYVNTGDAFRLGPFTQSRGQIALIAANLGTGLDERTNTRLDSYVEGVTGYLDDYGDRIVGLTRRGRREEARALLVQQAGVDRVKQLNRDSSVLYQILLSRQLDAENAARDRQYVNVGLTVFAGLVILATGIGVLLWIRREMMLPLDDMALTSRKLGHGDLAARVTPRGVDEIAVVSSAFNQMAEEVQQQVQQLHDLSAARSRFVSSVSHELRTPITSLRGYLELLAAGEAGELKPDQLHYVQIAERNARLLDELINDLLMLSRIQSGKISIKPEPVDIRGLLREMKAEMRPIAAEKRVDLVLVDTGDLIVSGDPLRLKQVFGNLIGNAIKYSPEGQAVVVRAFRVNRQVVVSVVDWGAGIPTDELPHLAEPFFRSSATAGVPGTGLGLAIAKQMIELHGGRLAVESEPGAGSTFTAYLPMRQSESSADGVERLGQGTLSGGRARDGDASEQAPEPSGEGSGTSAAPS